MASEAGNHWIKFSGFDGEATANRTVYINVDNGEDDSNGNGLDDNGSGDNDAEVNHPPRLEKIGNKIKSPGETLSFKVSAHAPDGIDKNNIRYEVDDFHEYFNEETIFETIIIKINSIPEFTGFLLNGVVVDETEPIIFTAGRDNYLEIKAHDSDNDRIEIEINNIEGHLDADKHFVFNENNNTGILSWAPTSDRIGEELSITFKVTDYPGELYDVYYTSSNLVSIVIRVE